MDSNHYTQPIVIRETNETQSKDLAAIIQAASKSNSVLSSVWFRKFEPRFTLLPEHVAVSVGFMCITSFVMAILLQAEMVIAFGVAVAVAVLTAVSLVSVLLRNANTTEYEVNYESLTQNEASITRKTYKIDITKGTQTNFVDLPRFFDETAVLRLARMAQSGQRFNVRNVVDHNICKQPEFPELRDKLALAQMLEKEGKSWQLTDAFFAFANEVEHETD